MANTSKVAVEINGTPTILYVPQVNLNGTSKGGLMDDLCNAHRALREAREVLCQTTPHGRDWQTVADDAEYAAARTMHQRRVAKLTEVMDELDALAGEIAIQG